MTTMFNISDILVVLGTVIMSTLVYYMSSSDRLSVTFVHHTQAVEIFCNISTPLGGIVIHWHRSKILQRSV